MTKNHHGSAEWFKRETYQLIEQAKAVDSFAAAARSFQKLVEMGNDPDAEVRSALHTAGVVHYGRPFSGNRSAGGAKFALSVIKRHSKYDAKIHRQLLDLRDKVIAHSDHEYASGDLLKKSVIVQGSKQPEAFLHGFVCREASGNS